jgi:hypothetical protein
MGAIIARSVDKAENTSNDGRFRAKMLENARQIRSFIFGKAAQSHTTIDSTLPKGCGAG